MATMNLKIILLICVTQLQTACAIPAISIPSKVIGTIADDEIYKNRENKSKKAIAEGGKLHPPIGKIILIRSKTDLCALQFGESQLLQKRQALKDEPIISRLYAWHILVFEPSGAQMKILDSGNDVVRVGPNTAMHMTPGVDYGKNKVSCGGRFELTGDIGGWLTNYPTTKQEYEFAATPWEKFTDISPLHPKLQWINLRKEAKKFLILDIDY